MTPSNKTETFFHGMITAEFLPFETYEKDAEAIAMADRLKQRLLKMKKPYEGSYALCELVVYTVSLTFNWSDEVPEEYRAFETWWEMVQAKTPFEQSFLFYATKVHNSMVENWWNAKKAAYQIWKPTEEKAPDQLTDGEKEDPNSTSDSV